LATVAPYGSWQSPISARQVASGGRRRSGAVLAGDGALWWAEMRPDEGGRTALMRRAEGGVAEEATPAGANARTRVHEYGGGAWTLAAPDVVVYAEFGDQRLYRWRLGEKAHVRQEVDPSRRQPHRRQVARRPRTERSEREANQASAPAVEDGLFLVPKVIE